VEVGDTRLRVGVLVASRSVGCVVGCWGVDVTALGQSVGAHDGVGDMISVLSAEQLATRNIAARRVAFPSHLKLRFICFFILFLLLVAIDRLL
jgi:hypothetical protein